LAASFLPISSVNDPRRSEAPNLTLGHLNSSTQATAAASSLLPYLTGGLFKDGFKAAPAGHLDRQS